ncbi:MAG: hypothetical protein HKN92_07320, partial [Chitinophagales bacterium]|nr:hypothetical protein [Chitinophagales bacterium]
MTLIPKPLKGSNPMLPLLKAVCLLVIFLSPLVLQAQQYCGVYGFKSQKSWISAVNVGSNFTCLSARDMGYGDYKHMTINAEPNSQQYLSLTASYPVFSKISFWSVYIDYNKDGDFVDAGEIVFQGSGKKTVNGILAIPAWVSGQTTMRVSSGLQSFPPACGMIFKGEAEDYTINFSALSVDSCMANAGTITAVFDTQCATGGQALINATPDGNSIVPPGFITTYVLTSSNNLVIEQVSAFAEFQVSGGGLYTIHTLVHDTTLDLSIIVPGVTTGFDVNALLIQGGGNICASLDVVGASIVINEPKAGTLTSDPFIACDPDSVIISASLNGDASIPPGFSTVFVLTSGGNLLIEQLNTSPVFIVNSGSYKIHTLVYNPNTLDLSNVTPGNSTAVDVLNLLVQGGGSICGSLDVAGATFEFLSPDAGTLTAVADTVCALGGTPLLEAIPDGNEVVPNGYQVVYVLTSGSGLVIEQTNLIPEFNVMMGGLFTIHTLVYDSNTLDLSIVTPGLTTGFDINSLLIQGGGSICASLDLIGASILIEYPYPGSLSANPFNSCLNDTSTTTISASHMYWPMIPPGYSQIYVLTSGSNLVIEQVSSTPQFDVIAGSYTIHTLVYNPNTLDLSIVIPGITTGLDIVNLIVQGGGTICAALDVSGAQFKVESAPNAGTLTPAISNACLVNGQAIISAVSDGNQHVPTGYILNYVLTSGNSLIIEQLSAFPEFVVNSGGSYTIHSLVYDSNTLDLSIVIPGITSGFDVNTLLIQGGGNICASLDVTGASVNANAPDAGSLTPTSTSCYDGGNATLTAMHDSVPSIPDSYSFIYVLTSGNNYIMEALNSSPTFTVSNSGLYRIHTLVYDSNTLDLSTVSLGVSSALDINEFLVQGGGSICAALDLNGAVFNLFPVDAGSLSADMDTICLLDSTGISATPDGNAIIPAGYQIVYVLTSGSGLVIEQSSDQPIFNVSAGGLYTIHTLVYDSNTLDLGIIIAGVTTGFDVNALLVQGGGSICASLDVAGAQIIVDNPFAGTTTANVSSICYSGGTQLITATPNGDEIIPAGYSLIYVLTSGPGLVIEQVAMQPSFQVSSAGLFTIHSLVYDSNSLDLSIITPGVTTGVDVNALLIQGGGSICASLDVNGASVTLTEVDAGTITAADSSICLLDSALISATPDGNIVFSEPFQVLYVLTAGSNLVIEQVGLSPEFTIDHPGIYTIHTLVYDPNTLDLTIVIPGVTTGFDVNALLTQGGGSICASLDVAGAKVWVDKPFAGSLTAGPNPSCSAALPFNLTANPNGDAIVPSGYSVLYVLTSGGDLTIQQTNTTPSFTVFDTGSYTIHTLVYDSNTLDLSIVIPGMTTGLDVNNLLVQGGGNICASLDVTGASFDFSVQAHAGTISGGDTLCFDNTEFITATPNGDAIVPVYYLIAYVLTSGDDLIIEALSDFPEFPLSNAGLFTIHTLVYDSSTLDLSIVVPGVTTGFDVNALLIQGGGSVCAALDVNGTKYLIERPYAGTLIADFDSVCFADSAIVSATIDSPMLVPDGYLNLYVLTTGTNLVIEKISANPEFTIDTSGLFTIHSLVYNPITLDLNVVLPGNTTGFDLFTILVPGGGGICASLDVSGAPIEAILSTSCGCPDDDDDDDDEDDD